VTATETDNDLAARWAVRIDAESLSPDDEQALEAWLAEDERRRGALLRAQAALSYLDRARAISTENDGYVTSQSRIARRRFLIGGAVGVAAAGVAGIALLRPTGLLSPVSNPAAAPLKLATVIGEVRRVPLSDGSIAAINTASNLKIIMEPKRRRVRLEDGEAWFQVAHDRERPFVVSAGKVQVQAIGTAFSVRLRDGGADVLVTEGTVETWIEGREETRIRLTAGKRSFIAEEARQIEVIEGADTIERKLAWRSGELALNGETLGYAVAELNRYNERQLVIEDPQLGQESLVGYFRTSEPENFGRAVAAMLGARVIDDGSKIRLQKP
jgi:transmembrane sensor